MNQKNISLVSGSFFGLTSVLLGAFGAHYLNTILPTAQLTIFETAVRYQMYHALILCILGFLAFNYDNKTLIYACYSFIVGVVLFSGSLYLYLALDIVLFAIITPIGGLFLISGWTLLLFFAISFKVEKNGF